MDTKDTKEEIRISVRGLVLSVLGSLCVLGVLCGESAVMHAQPGGFAMPDPKEMSGIPRPVDDLPSGSISVRLIRGALSNNIAGHPVALDIGGTPTVVKTDENGRAQFDKVPAGTKVKASADVDGEHLESQEFAAPAQGGVRLLLVATDPTKAAAPARTAAPAAIGTVVIGPQSRIVLQPRDEAVDVFYLLDIANNSTGPVSTAAPFEFNMPADAKGCGIMQGSSPQASLAGTHVVVAPPFAPGSTFVQVACEVPALTGGIDIEQRFPATLEQLAVVVKKVGETTLRSAQVREQREMPADGETFIAATGGAVAAGQVLELSVSGVPHHSPAPRRIALTLVVAIALVGTWAASGRVDDGPARAADRKRLVARRDKLMNELVRLEQDYRAGRLDDRRRAQRRAELVTSLEQIYGALDGDDTGPEPADRAGRAA
jgi:hypothetical protein